MSQQKAQLQQHAEQGQRSMLLQLEFTSDSDFDSDNNGSQAAEVPVKKASKAKSKQ